MDVFIYLYLVNCTPILASIIWYRSRTKRGVHLAFKVITTALVYLAVFFVHGVFVATELWVITVASTLLNIGLWLAVIKFRPSNKFVSKSRAQGKPSNELIVVAKLILADDKVSQKEAEQLLELLNCTPISLMDPITRTLFQAVEHALSDAVLDETEADEIRVLLGEVCDLELERKVLPAPPKRKQKPKQAKSKLKPRSKGATVTDIRNGDIFDILYFDANHNPSNRKVDFISVRSSNGSSYMNAWCHDRAALRTFRVDRIHSMVNVNTGEVVSNIKRSLSLAK